VNIRFKNVLGWVLLVWGFAAGIVSWIGRKTERISAILIVSAYLAVLIYGFFFQPREEFRKARFKYLGFAVILVFWSFLCFAAFSR
jgi:hypothetical protein